MSTAECKKNQKFFQVIFLKFLKKTFTLLFCRTSATKDKKTT